MMSRFFYTALFILFVAMWFLPAQTEDLSRLRKQYDRADSLYEYSDNLAATASSSEAEEEQLTRDALEEFDALIPGLVRNHADSLLFHSLWKRGVLYQYFDSSAPALRSYLDALRIDSVKTAVPDSFYYLPLLYAGSIYHARENYDSAEWYYERASQVSSRYRDQLPESQRVYNRLGALYYTTGNYQDAITYFQKALQLLNRKDPMLDYFEMGYRNNIASCLLKLKEFSKAREIYLQLQNNSLIQNQVINNIGITYLEEGNAAEALQYFRRLKSADAHPLLPTQLARSYQLLQKPDSAAYFFNIADRQLSQSKALRQTNAGINDRYYSSFLLEQKDYAKALATAQTGIQKIYPAAGRDWYRNQPLHFSGILAFEPLYQLFRNYALAQTALANSSNDDRLLEPALTAWENAYGLAAFVGQTYSSNDAQLFLAALRNEQHSEPLSLAYRLYSRTGNQRFIDKAFYFDQSQKAGIITMQQVRQELRLSSEKARAILDEQTRLRRKITALAGSNPAANEAQRTSEDSLMQTLQYQLVKTEEALSELPEYRSRNLAAKPAGIAEVASLLSSNQWVLSYTLSKHDLYCIAISQNKQLFRKIPLPNDFDAMLAEFLSGLYQQSFHLAADTAAAAKPESADPVLYKTIWEPLQSEIEAGASVTIIPGGLLSYLPFEAIRNAEGRFLLEDYGIQYQYNSALLAKSKPMQKNAEVLALAPFANTELRLENKALSALPESLHEVGDTRGVVLANQQATKQALLEQLNRYPILHLATHAEAEDSAASSSRIYLYPSEKDTLSYLTEMEIRSLDLDSTQLVILSACETGTGKLAEGEGILSLSRALRYAGCPNIITSMWRADDRSTAYIMEAFYRQLDKGASIEEALRNAKLQWLTQKDIRPTLRRPAYWAHLVFVGDIAVKKNSGFWIWIIAVAIGLVAISIAIYRRSTSTNAHSANGEE